jgi:hypothetical protein
MMKFIFPLLLLVIIPLMPAWAQAPFKVENVKINLKGVNPVEAREKALAAAQLKAFKALFKGLNKGEELSFDESRVPGLLEDFELVDEQIAPNRYAATYTFRFKRLATQEMVREAQYAAGTPPAYNNNDAAYVPPSPPQQGNQINSPYSDLFKSPQQTEQVTRQEPIQAPLLLAYWKENTTPVLWGTENKWQNTWKRLERSVDTQSAFILPIGDLSDMRLTSEILPEQQSEIDQLLARYQTASLIVAVGQKAIGSITTTLYRADQNGLIFWKVIDSPLGPPSDPYSVAAGQIIAEIRGNSNPALTSLPAKQQIQTAQNEQPFFVPEQQGAVTETIRAEGRFNSPREWLELKSIMNAGNGVAQVRVLSLTPRAAVLELQLSKSVLEVQQNLGARSVALKETGSSPNPYIVKFMGS